MRITLALVLAAVAALSLWWILSPSQGDAELEFEPLLAESRPASAAQPTSGPGAPERNATLEAVPLPALLGETDLEAAEADLPRGGTLIGSLVWEGTWAHARDLEVQTTTRWIHSAGLGPEDRPFLRNVVDRALHGQAALTDAQGRFRIEGVPQDRTTFLVVRVDGAVLELVKLDRLPPAGVTIDLGEIRLSPRGSVRGRIEHGGSARVRIVDDPLFENALLDPAEHARMLAIASEFVPEAFAENQRRRTKHLPFPEASTDEDGNFQVRGVRPGLVWLVVDPKQGEVWRKRILVEPGKETFVGTLTEDRSRSATPRLRIDEGIVRVHWTKGRGETLSEIEFETSDGQRTTVTSDGHAANLEAHKVRTARIRRRADLPWERVRFSLEMPGPTGPGGPRPRMRITVEIPPPASLVVRVLDARGEPVAGARAEIHRTDLGPLGPQSKILDLAGEGPRERRHFVARGLARTRYWILIRLPGDSQILREHDAEPQENAELTVFDRGARDLTIQCRDRDGNPVVGAEVWAAQMRRTAEPRFVGRSDARGCLRVLGVPREGVAFAAQHPAFATTPAEPSERDGELVITLDPGAHVTGVVTERGERTSSTWMVMARPSEAMATHYASNPFLEPRIAATTSQGTFELRGLVPGTWTITIAHPRAARKTLDLAQLGRQDVVLELDPEALRSQACQVTVDGIHGAGLVARLVAGGQHFAQRVTRDGSFAFAEVPQGTCVLSFERLEARTAPAVLWQQELQGPPSGQTIAIRTGSVALTLLGPDRMPLVGVEATLELVSKTTPRSGLVWSMVTDTRGLGRIDGIPEGTWQVRAAGFQPGRRGATIEVRAGIVTELTLPKP